jgi:type IV pilus assembly protein PilE
MGRHARGWTLIELVIALAVVAIIAAFAYSAYNDQVIKSRRSDGQAMLFAAAQRQQQFFTINGNFTATVGEGGLEMSTASPEGFYTLLIAATANTYTLIATRAGLQAADTGCGNLTLNHLGAKGTVGGTLPAAKCW